MSKLNRLFSTVPLEEIEQSAQQQIFDVLELDCLKKLAIMPDVHAGYDLPIGGVALLEGMISPSFVGYDIGCLDKDTEFLSPSGWVKISEYGGGEVLQYNPTTDEASFVVPQRYVVQPSEGFYHLWHKDGMDQMLSSGHKVLFWHGYKSRGYKPKVYATKELVEKHRSLGKGLQGGIKTTFKLSNPDLDMTDAILRVIVMVSADGHIRKQGTTELHFRKERKIIRAQELLNQAGINYELTVGVDGSTYIYFRDYRVTKDLSIFWASSEAQLRIIAEECLHWDGTVGEHEAFSATCKQNADLIQYAFTVAGARTGIHCHSYEGKDWNSTWWVYKTKNEYVGLTKNEAINFVSSQDGKEYCFTVPSGYFVARRNNKIFITGNCGMCSLDTGIKAASVTTLRGIYNDILKVIPTGFSSHTKDQGYDWVLFSDVMDVNTHQRVQAKVGTQLGTLGGGNHFIELGENQKGNLCVTIHSGSRNVGHTIGGWYMKKGRLFPLESELGQAYLQDMNFALEWALENRLRMMTQVLQCLGLHPNQLANRVINENHNHAVVTPEGVLHRKGATPADLGQLGVIPANMRDGVYITEGLGESYYLSSASHGCGRVMGRNQAKKTLDYQEFKDGMQGIICSTNRSILDEAPAAYKDINYVLAKQEGVTVSVIDHIRPLLNIKAAE